MFLSLLVSCRRIFMTFSGMGCVTSKKLFESIMHKVSSSIVTEWTNREQIQERATARKLINSQDESLKNTGMSHGNARHMLSL